MLKVSDMHNPKMPDNSAKSIRRFYRKLNMFIRCHVNRKEKIVNFFLFFFLAAAGILPPCSAGAAEFKNAPISLELPVGWHGEYEPTYEQLQISAPGEDYFFAVQIVPNGGKNNFQFAVELSEKLNGTFPQQIEDSENYFFSTLIDGTYTEVTTVTAGKKTMVYTEIGRRERYDEPLQEIWSSMHSSEADVQAIIDLIR